jgi:flagellar hook-basal body protein
MALTGDGFFMVQSVDGSQTIFTRNGGFQLDSSNVVVNSAGQKLLAAKVDELGGAEFQSVQDMQALRIPRLTEGKAVATTEIDLSINLPKSAPVIPSSVVFDPNKPETYSLSTSMNVYDKANNKYLAKVYYVKTQEPSETDPTGKWQTHTYVNGEPMRENLMQATDADGKPLYVNKFGQLLTSDEITKLKQTTAVDPSRIYTLDVINNNKVDSTPGSFTGALSGDLFNAGIKDVAIDTPIALSLAIDGGAPRLVNFTLTAGKYTGTELAKQLENEINKAFGEPAAGQTLDLDDQRYGIKVKFSPDSTGKQGTFSIFSGTTGENSLVNVLATPADLQAAVTAAATRVTNATAAVTSATTAATLANTTATTAAAAVTAANTAETTAQAAFASAKNASEAAPNDTSLAAALATATTNLSTATTTLTAAQAAKASADAAKLAADEALAAAVAEKTAAEAEKIATEAAKTSLDTTLVSGVPNITSFYGFGSTKLVDGAAVTADKFASGSGLASKPAVLVGETFVGLGDRFLLNSANSKFVVTVDNVVDTIEMDTKIEYTKDSFLAALQTQINDMSNAAGRTVSGVKVEFEPVGNALALKFTSGSQGSSAFIKVSGSGSWGLANAPSASGETSTWVNPIKAQYIDANRAESYVDIKGNELDGVEDVGDIEEDGIWAPVFLDKGELTFDRDGKLFSPASKIAYNGPFVNFSVDYAGTTNYNAPLAVLTQLQNGKPEGDLIGVTVGNDGLVTANYSNGIQEKLGKIILANFTAPTGLRQLGDSSFVATAEAGTLSLGEPGEAGFAAVRAGATERSNVDLTQELIELITAQRNFQANAKAIETANTMTQAIVNIRS